MFSHVTLGCADTPRGISFYDAVLAPLGLKRIETFETAAAYATAPETTPQFWIMRPLNEAAPSVGNGVTIGFEATDRAAVDAFHAAALAQGGTDEGAPGLRPHYHPDYYGAYARDLDGNKICCACHRPA